MEETRRSGPHRQVEKILEAMSLEYVSEEPAGPYRLDIYLPEWHLCIEVDGPNHRPKADKRRDEYLLAACKIPTLRIKQTAIDKEQTPVVITEFIEIWAASGDVRKAAYYADD